MLTCLRSVLVLALITPGLAAAQQPPASSMASVLAYVSPQRAFFESNDGKAAQTRLSELQAVTSKEVETRSARLKAMQTALAETGSLLADPARRQREHEIDRFQVDLKRFVEDAQAQFLGVQRNLENAFLAKFGPAVDAVAKSKGLLFVINQDSGVLAWADPSYDITKDVVERVNQP